MGSRGPELVGKHFYGKGNQQFTSKMLLLFETAAGFAIFKLLDDSKLSEVENLFKDFETPEGANRVVQLQHFKKFQDSAEALQAGVALNEGKVAKPLKKLLKKVFTDEVQDKLA